MNPPQTEFCNNALHRQTFNKYFSSQGEMLAAMAEWLRDKPDFADVAATTPAAPVPKKSHRPAVFDGSVYLIGSGAHYKIGRSEQLERRVKEIRTALIDAAPLVRSIRCAAIWFNRSLPVCRPRPGRKPDAQDGASGDR